jgi:HK97 family phage major capsid protein
MYEDTCQHGYIASSCASCRHAQTGLHTEINSPYEASPSSAVLLERYGERHRGKSRAELDSRRGECVTRAAELKGYEHLSQPQREEADALAAEMLTLDELIGEDDIVRRSEQIERVRLAAQNPANLEAGTAGAPLAPSLVKGLGDRVESAAETLQRFRSNPWQHEDGPITRMDTTAGLISRCHSALEGLEPQLTHDGAEKLAQVLADSSGWPGMTVKRSRDEQAEAAELFLCLSNPHYFEAFRSVLRYPMEFGAGGTGFETLTDEQRQAWREVRTNLAVRASFAESSGATGAFALPLQLDDTIILTNAGVAAPHRQLARNVIGTSNTWNGVTSAGVTASWVAEASPVSDATPAIGQLVITPYKEAAYITGSLEIIGDTNLDQQVPALIADARARLEGTAFATGTGSTQPFGLITRGASDASTGALAASQIYNLLANMPPRFRVYAGAKPVWLANVAIINAARQIPAFTGANFSIVDDTGDMPRMLNLPFYESSAMTNLNTVGAKNLLLGDLSQYVVVDRLPTVMIFEPLVKNATPLPTGQQGWFFYARVGADITTAGAAFGSNAFVFHTV